VAKAALLGSSLLGAGVYGLGTVADLAAPSVLPSTSVVSAIVQDATGWPALGRALAEADAPIFALDYSAAGQIRYYSGRPATTAWGQYRIWGIPDLKNATILSLDYLPTDWVASRLAEAFEKVTGPEDFAFSERGAAKTVHVWIVEGLEWHQERFIDEFDFLTMLDEAP
jgi:hypothetical protein